VRFLVPVCQTAYFLQKGGGCFCHEVSAIVFEFNLEGFYLLNENLQVTSCSTFYNPNIYLDSNQSRKKSFGAQVSLSESSYTSVIHETASPNQISSTSVVQETLMTSQRESVAHKSLQVSMTSSDESEGVSVDKVSMTSSEKSNDESAKSSESLVVKVLTTTSDERSSPESNGNEKVT